MAIRIHEVLFVSSPYDLYIMEEEGILADRISDEYTLLHLTNAPVITRASTAEEALGLAKQRRFDLVITGLRVGKGNNPFDMAHAIKKIQPGVHTVLLAPEGGRIPIITKQYETLPIDKVFYWHGDTRLFLAIIKSFEDKANAPYDCIKEQVRVIILVEDSPHFYSAYLPLIYTEIMEQTRSLIAEGATADEKLQRMRSRPKILMARNYEEATELYERYKANMLGIISDVRFPRKGSLDPEAGFKFTELVKKDNPDLPVLLQSKDTENADLASKLGATYIDKNSPHLLADLSNFVKTYFGFGQFIFRDSNGNEVGRAGTLLEMEKTLASVPDETMKYHSERNHFSNWLFARGEFELAAKLRPLHISDFNSIDELRIFTIESIKEARMAKRKATIARFSEINLDLSMPFMRFGGGSIGGKGRGIGFMSKLLSRPDILSRFKGAQIYVPETAAVGTDVFDSFMERNKLRDIAIEQTDNSKIAEAFLRAELSPKIAGELAAFLKRMNEPLAVRSSSLSEDSLSQPFAGLYSTYLIPNNHPDFEERLKQFLSAIKLVFASTYFADPKAYMEANAISIEGEKMAVVIQKIVGRRRGNHYYPDVAGVAQSYNFFPVGYMKPEDGIAQLVMGLGTMAVRGERALRFCPKYPAILPQFGTSRDILARSQRAFQAVDLSDDAPRLFIDEDVTLSTLDLGIAEKDGLLGKLGGVYSVEDDIIYEGLTRDGPRVVTFSQILKGGLFPLSDIVAEVMDIGSAGMGCPVEIEFAANVLPDGVPQAFWFLQIRPLVSGEEEIEVSLEGIKPSECIASSNTAMGNGSFADLQDIIYVKPDAFDLRRTAEIAQEIGKFNSKMVSLEKSYILLGFGRWGTANPLLGIPVAYSQISHAKVICEISTPELDVEPSQGTHFFHNITSSRIGYLSITNSTKQNFVDWSWFEKEPAVGEGEYVRHVKSKTPCITKIDGRSSRGMILKPR
ncbi:MAG: PEP/pyruvate-binding domain-containing protein [Pseudomonadota bacterium]